MSSANLQNGLMELKDEDNLNKIREKIYGSTKPKRSLDYKISQLIDQELLIFENALKFTIFLQHDQVKRKGFRLWKMLTK